MGDVRYLTEIPSSLKQLARLVVRGFYTIEDALVIDMLVRNPCKLDTFDNAIAIISVNDNDVVAPTQAWKKTTSPNC